MGLLHPAGRGGAFPGSFSGQLFAGRFPTRGFASSLLGSGHFLSPKEDTHDSRAARQGVGARGTGRLCAAPLPSRLFAPHLAAADGRGLPAAAASPLMTQAARSSRLPREGERGEESFPLLDGRRPRCPEADAEPSEQPASETGRDAIPGTKSPGENLSTPRPMPAARAARTRPPTAATRGPNGCRGPKPPANPRTLTQRRSLRPLLSPRRRSRRPRKSRSPGAKCTDQPNE